MATPIQLSAPVVGRIILKSHFRNPARGTFYPLPLSFKPVVVAPRFEGKLKTMGSLALVVLGALGGLASWGKANELAVTPLSQIANHVATSQSTLHNTLFQLALSKEATPEQLVEAYCQTLSTWGTLAQADTNPQAVLDILLASKRLSEEDKVFCRTLLEDVRAHGKVVWHPPVTTFIRSGKTTIPIRRAGYHSYVQDPNYSLEKMFDRFADTILYRHAIIRFENNEPKARQVVTQIKEQTHQVLKDAKNLEMAHGLWVLACFVSLSLIPTGGVVAAMPD